MIEEFLSTAQPKLSDLSQSNFYLNQFLTLVIQLSDPFQDSSQANNQLKLAVPSDTLTSWFFLLDDSESRWLKSSPQ